MSPRISGEELKRELIAFARELGFHSCRIAACAPPPHATEFRNWLREGAAGEMHYMERGEEKRCDPQKVLPGARSIIVVALNYFQGHMTPRSQTAATGEIARYAWGDDYHDVMRGKAGQDRQFPWWIRRTAKMLRRYRSHSGTRLRSPGRDRLARQKHNANRSAPGYVVFSRRDLNNARSTSG